MTINVLISNFTDPQDGTVIGNIATADSDQHGPVTDNADVVVSAGKLLVTKETLVNAVQIGETIQYNVSVRNVGSDTLSNITFNDTLPLGQAFIQTGSTTGCTGASIAPTIVTCTVSNLTPGSSHDITILARKVIPGETDPTGVVGLTDPLHGTVDTNQACAFNNNVPQSCATSTVENVGAPNIILTKTGADTVVPGTTIVNVITITNTGNDSAVVGPNTIYNGATDNDQLTGTSRCDLGQPRLVCRDRSLDEHRALRRAGWTTRCQRLIIACGSGPLRGLVRWAGRARDAARHRCWDGCCHRDRADRL